MSGATCGGPLANVPRDFRHEVRDKATAAVESADCSYGFTLPARYAAEASGRGEEPAIQASLLRDVVANPFQPMVFKSCWRTPQVLELAQ